MATLRHLAFGYMSERQQRHELATVTLKTTRWVLLSFTSRTPDAPERLTRRHVERWLADQRCAANTLYNRFSILRSFCRWLVACRHIRRDVTIGIIGPRRARSLPRSLHPSEVGSVLAKCPDHRGRLMVSLMVFEGLRRVEVARLQVGDINLDQRIMLVRGKGNAERYLPLTDASYRALSAYLDDFPATSGPLVRSYQFPTRPLTPDHIGRLVVEWMTDAGVKRRPRDGKSAHAFRHTCASDVLDAGANIRQVQLMLGHASLETTQIYLRRTDAAALRVVMNGRSYVADPLSVSE